VNASIIDQLLELNRQFYQTFTRQFSATRQRLQPGVKQILAKIDPAARLLDLGCGNGETARALAAQGFHGRYVGLDSSAGFLQEARDKIGENPHFAFICQDLASPGWNDSLPQDSYDAVLAFAILHHLPGATLRRQVIERIRTIMIPQGHFMHSEWQFLNSPRLRDRLQPWQAIGLDEVDVEPGDHLLDWREGGTGLRYVHHFSLEELALLAEQTGFEIIETFHSDGENERLGLYQIWKRV
jgi:SAM-dependent methyltransferase